MTAPAKPVYRVVRHGNGRQWNVVDAAGRVVEGGFFSRDAAVESCAAWNRGEA